MPPTAPKATRGRPRGGPTFKPPRPTGQAKATKTNKDSNRRKSAPAKPAPYTDTDEDELDADEAEDREDDTMETSSRHDDDDAETSDASPAPTIDNDPPPVIPPALLSTLVHHHLPSKKTRIKEDAMGVVGKYMETFVREAIARAAFERQEVTDAAEKRTAGDDFVDVMDLEKLAVQLLLDF